VEEFGGINGRHVGATYLSSLCNKFSMGFTYIAFWLYVGIEIFIFERKRKD